jgi:hypothetical protein
MKKVFIAMCLALLSHQTLAAPIAGITFKEIGSLDAYQGAYYSNVTGVPLGAPVDTPSAIADGNAGSYVMSGDATATLDLGFGTSLNVANRDLTILLVGNDAPHTIDISLLGGASGSPQTFSLDSRIDNTLGYTGFNAVHNPIPEQVGSVDPVVWGIYAMNIHLADYFSGSFTGVQLDISGSSAAPSIVGTTAVVPVPAAVWLFGSGLVGLAGIARKRA